MQEEIYNKLISIYNLGEIVKLPLRVHGGLLHKMWKIEYNVMPKETWEDLVKKSSTYKWADNLSNLVPHLLSLTLDIVSAQSLLSKESVISHRDLDQKNVLWNDKNIPYLIDWESTGKINPYQETITAAI